VGVVVLVMVRVVMAGEVVMVLVLVVASVVVHGRGKTRAPLTGFRWTA